MKIVVDKYSSNSPVRLRLAAFLLFISIIFLFSGIAGTGGEIHLEAIKLPTGFHIDIYSEGLPGARSMTLGEKGTLFVGTREEGNVYAIPPGTGGRGDAPLIIARNLSMPNGVAFHGGSLYVAEVSRILRFDNIESRLADPGRPVVLNDTLPRETHHGWKYLRFGPDGRLYFNIGAPCNICERDDPRYASIMRMNSDGSGLEVFASGVRNSVGFDWNPRTDELWFTDNGRDWLGDEIPPDELNRAPHRGLFFGFPYVYGDNIPDPEFAKKAKGGKFIQPVLNLPAHVAPLGMRFYTGTVFPPAYRGAIFIAEHGSWNRSVPIGYRVSAVRIEDDRAVRYEIFAEGWLLGGSAWGRPVDLLVMPDGALLVSDDVAGAIYRIEYGK